MYIVLEVPDLVCQEYTIPHQLSEQGFLQVSGVPPPIINFLPKPPPVPPPPENYYIQSDICSSLPLPPSPPLSPPNLGSVRYETRANCCFLDY